MSSSSSLRARISSWLATQKERATVLRQHPYRPSIRRKPVRWRRRDRNHTLRTFYLAWTMEDGLCQALRTPQSRKNWSNMQLLLSRQMCICFTDLFPCYILVSSLLGHSHASPPTTHVLRTNAFYMLYDLLYHFDRKFTNSENVLAEMADKFSFEF